jgi:hypothetical protein
VKKLALAAVLVVLAVIGIGYYGAHLPTANGASVAAAPNWSGTAEASMSAPSAPATPGQVSWITVRDPREQAFSIQVPQGWKTYGGLFRYSNIDARMLVDMTSPDGMTNLRIGDAAVPPYRVPGPFAPAGPGIAAYTAGNVFASKYGAARFGSMCSGVKLTKSDAVPPKYHPANSAFAHTTGGEAYFTCTKNGTAMSAYVYAETELLGPGGPGSSWLVVALASVIAPAPQGTAAGALLQHAGDSLAMNPAWTQMQNNLDNQAAAAINANTQATIARTQQENAREQGMIGALNNDAFDDVINGVQQMTDPNTGQKYTTPIGTGGAQWTNGGNTVVQSAMSPGAGFSQLAPAGR